MLLSHLIAFLVVEIKYFENKDTALELFETLAITVYDILREEIFLRRSSRKVEKLFQINVR